MKAPFKFVFTAILTVIFVCILCPTAFADTEIELKVGDAEFDFASTSFVDVPVFVTKNSSGFIDMQFTVEFDADIFETAALAQVPQSSILCYNPDERVSSTDYPQISVGADNSTGTLRIAMSGVFKKDQNGNDAQHKFLGVGEMFRLKFKVK
ncbi:MAG: hypothetical protein IJO48_06050, partial [Clostridia bacterium]|nr:hypothetical protein [Clostridia bacterium]